MKIDTNEWRNLSYRLKAYQRPYMQFSTISLRTRHEKIQRQLGSLADYLADGAVLYEDAENRIMNSALKIRDGKIRTGHNAKIDVISMITKTERDSYVSGHIQTSIKEISGSVHGKLSTLSGSLMLGTVRASGECSFGLWKEKKIDPHLDVEVKLEAALASADVYGKIGNRYLNINANAHGSVGALYAQAEAVLNKNEQKLDIGIGACALRGEASISFNVFGAKITLTGQGSIGSVEANLTYSHANREWIFGSKLGFIAGLGFKVRVNY